jgi:phage tail sheath protein FI
MKATGWALGAIGVVVVAVAAKKAKKRVRKAAKVYIEEVSSGSRPIEAVGTAVAAFVGFAE